MSKIIEINNHIYTDKILDEIISFIKMKKIIIMPSDTIYGFLALPSTEKKLREIKKREKKPFLYLISDIKQLESLGVNISQYSTIFNKHWPGPVTFIMKSTEEKTIGVRMPDWNILQNIIKQIGAPLISTSVNYTDMPSINNIDKIIKKFDDNVDLIIADKNFNPKEASSIIDITKATHKILRKGSTLGCKF
ncbi:MAG: threonylcarbamoyl-AMP synthase [Spirochaetes bacterium]|nr:threonylcarbamoyl-AMP synthase [Spirochaetota bacterium]